MEETGGEIWEKVERKGGKTGIGKLMEEEKRTSYIALAAALGRTAEDGVLDAVAAGGALADCVGDAAA